MRNEANMYTKEKEILQKVIFGIKSKIKGLTLEIKKNRARFNRKRPKITKPYDDMKNIHSRDMRAHLLAYGYIRGKKRSDFCSYDKSEGAEIIFDILNYHYKVSQLYGWAKYSQESIKTWLKEENTGETK